MAPDWGSFVRSFVAALIIVTFFLPLDIWVSIGPASLTPFSLLRRCEEVLISISFSLTLEEEEEEEEEEEDGRSGRSCSV